MSRSSAASGTAKSTDAPASARLIRTRRGQTRPKKTCSAAESGPRHCECTAIQLLVQTIATNKRNVGIGGRADQSSRRVSNASATIGSVRSVAIVSFMLVVMGPPTHGTVINRAQVRVEYSVCGAP